MRALVIAVVLTAGCGGKHAGSTTDVAVATVFPAARWVPANPSYVVSAHTIRDAQRAMVDVIDTVGLVFGADPKEASAQLQQLLAVDPLSADAVAAIGVDLEGSMVMFSEAIDPTLVFHLASPPAVQAFFDNQRKRGLVTQSVVVEGSELFTAKLASDLWVSWVIDNDWLWVHLTIGPGGAGPSWFEHSKHPASTDWVARWEAARKLATKAAGLVGFVRLRELVATALGGARGVLACARLVEAVDGVGIAIEGEGNSVGGRLSIDLGPAARTVAAMLLPPPPGWNAAASNAPLAAQWNLDLYGLAAWLAPCTKPMGIDIATSLDQLGIRTARAFVRALNVDDKSGTGAVAFDLAHGRFFAHQLDQIPLRSKFERGRGFGAYKGKHLSVPFVATADYVLDDRVAIAAMGDGLLDKIANGPASTQPPLFALDVLPKGLPAADWAFLLEQAGAPAPKRLAERLRSWQSIHLGARLERDSVVLEVAGNRR